MRRWGAGDVQSDGREERVRRRWRRERGRWTGGGGGGEEAEGEDRERCSAGNTEREKDSFDYAAHTHAARALMADRVGRVEGLLPPALSLTCASL